MYLADSTVVNIIFCHARLIISIVAGAGIGRSLNHFLQIKNRQKLPNWMVCRLIPVPVVNLSKQPTRYLWRVHQFLLRQIGAIGSRESPQQPSVSLLDLKAELCQRFYRLCRLCPWDCRVDRSRGEKGVCGLSDQAVLFRSGIHWNEEPVLRPTQELFLTGCNMRCLFCQSWRGIVQPQRGQVLSPARFARLTNESRLSGANHLHLVGGEPTVSLLAILNGLQYLTQPVPIVWNTNLFLTRPAMDLLNGVSDLIVADLKFGNDECAQTVAGVRPYWETVTPNLQYAAKFSDVIVRHLLMPGHVDCCWRRVAFWLRENLPGVPVHLMLNYCPDWKALRDPLLNRFCSEAERQEALKIGRAIGVDLLTDPMGGCPVPSRPPWSCWTDRSGATHPHGIIKDGPMGHRDGEKEIWIYPDGTVAVPDLTAELGAVLTGLVRRPKRTRRAAGERRVGREQVRQRP